MTFSPRLLLPCSLAPEQLRMPDQSLTAPFRDPPAPGLHRNRQLLVCRVLVFLLQLCCTAALVGRLIDWFTIDGRLTMAKALLAGLSGFAFFWMVLSVATAALGLCWKHRSTARPLDGLKALDWFEALP